MKDDIKDEKNEVREEEHRHVKKRKRLSKGFVAGIIVGLCIAGVCVGGYWYYLESKNTDLTPEKIKTIATDFINENLMGGGKIEGLTIKDKKTYYNVSIAVAKDNNVDTVIAADGSKFCVSAMDIKKKEEAASNTQKSDKPSVELFVMSHCPYGTQVEKGIIPAIEALGDKIDFTLKFCDYSMHGETELKEEMNQYCIQKEQKDKFLPYLKCFLKEGKSDNCIASIGIDKAKLSSCVSSTDKEFSIISNYKNKVGYKGDYPGFTVYANDNTAYGVEGSPTLVINGAISEPSGRDSNSLLKTICSAFNNAPESCNSQLSAEAPSAGFGEGTSESSSGGCAE